MPRQLDELITENKRFELGGLAKLKPKLLAAVAGYGY